MNKKIIELDIKRRQLETRSNELKIQSYKVKEKLLIEIYKFQLNCDHEFFVDVCSKCDLYITFKDKNPDAIKQLLQLRLNYELSKIDDLIAGNLGIQHLFWLQVLENFERRNI